MSHNFRTDYDASRPVTVYGSLLNRQNSVLSSVAIPALGASHQNGIDGSNVGAVPVIQGVAQVIRPLAGNKYDVAFTYKEAATGLWRTLNTELQLDATVYRRPPETVSVSNPVAGPVPLFQVGDRVPAIYVRASSLCIPLIGPPAPELQQVFRGSEKVEVPRGVAGATGATIDAAHLVVEQYENFAWVPLAPDLILSPHNMLGLTSGQQTIITTMRQYNMLRLKIGTSSYSRAVMSCEEYGIAIRPLAPIRAADNPANGLNNSFGTLSRGQPTDGYATLRSLLPVAGTFRRFNDMPYFGVENDALDTLRIIMADPADTWLVELTVWAQVSRENLLGFVKIPTADSPGRGQLQEPNSDGLHDAIMVRDYDGSAYDSNERDMRCWLAFSDGDWRGEICVERGRVYGPAVYAGDSAGRPIYAMTMQREEYLAKSTSSSGTAAKGADQEFELLGGDLLPTGILRTANCAFNAYRRGKLAMIWRMNGRLLANQIECGT